MSDQFIVLSIDDNPANQKLVEAALKSDYQVYLAPSGEQGLALLDEVKPDVILLDVDMPGMNGYEVCAKLRESYDMDAMPVLFISAMDKVSDRIMGYESGGNDYMVKPINIAEVKHKITRLIEVSKQQQGLQDSLQYSTETAMSAMTYNGELGVLIEFFEHAITSFDYATLAQCALDACRKYSLNASVQIRTGEDLLEWTTGGQISPLESQLLEYGAQANRIVTHGSFMFLNAPNVTLLLKKLPLDDMDRVERMRDHVAIVLKGLEAQFEVIQARENKRQRRSDAIDAVSNSGVEMIHQLIAESEEFSQKIEEGYEDLKVRIVETCSLNELEKQEEEAFLSELETYRNQVRESLAFFENFKTVMDQLNQQLQEISEMS